MSEEKLINLDTGASFTLEHGSKAISYWCPSNHGPNVPSSYDRGLQEFETEKEAWNAWYELMTVIFK